MKLYGYFRSSAAYRVRIALGLKGLDFEPGLIHLRKNDQFSSAYDAINPQHLIPSLEDDGRVLHQSLAIIEYLDEAHPGPPLLPGDALGRARVRALAQMVACDIHPIDNLRVLKYLQDSLGADEKAVEDWFNHWIRLGFDAIERMLATSPDTGTFCHGDAPGLADICLIPQVHNARRYAMDLGGWPTISRIEAACLAMEAFDRARPDNQPDAE